MAGLENCWQFSFNLNLFWIFLYTLLLVFISPKITKRKLIFVFLVHPWNDFSPFKNPLQCQHFMLVVLSFYFGSPMGHDTLSTIWEIYVINTQSNTNLHKHAHTPSQPYAYPLNCLNKCDSLKGVKNINVQCKAKRKKEILEKNKKKE